MERTADKSPRGGGQLSEELQRKLKELLQHVLQDQRFLDEFATGRQAVLSRASANGYHLALVLIPEATRKPLSPRQAQIAALVGQGLRNRSIARELGISEGTVADHLKHIYEKWGIHSRAALARYAALLFN